MAKTKQIEEHRAGDEFTPCIARQTGARLNQVETAAYISDIVLQLRNMAKAADLKFLVYFLEMAFQEAFSQTTRETEKNGGPDK